MSVVSCWQALPGCSRGVSEGAHMPGLARSSSRLIAASCLGAR